SAEPGLGDIARARLKDANACCGLFSAKSSSPCMWSRSCCRPGCSCQSGLRRAASRVACKAGRRATQSALARTTGAAAGSRPHARRAGLGREQAATGVGILQPRPRDIAQSRFGAPAGRLLRCTWLSRAWTRTSGLLHQSATRTQDRLRHALDSRVGATPTRLVAGRACISTEEPGRRRSGRKCGREVEEMTQRPLLFDTMRDFVLVE